jgi:uncharacterized membrane protein YhaH (DUF805 family)/membrane protease YdiL (CAAX protease family)
MISDRIGRLEFLLWCSVPIVVGSIVSVLIGVSIGVIAFDSDDSALRTVVTPVVLIASVVILRAAVRRLHDLGWSGWFVLLMFAPLLNMIVFLFLLFAPGQKNQNSYGAQTVFLQRLRKMTNSSATIVSSTATCPRNEISPGEKRQRWFEVCLVLLAAFGSSILYSLYLLKDGPSAMPHISSATWSIGIVQEATALLLLGYVLSRRGLGFSSLGFRWSLRSLGVGVLVTGLSYAAYALGFTLIHVFHYSIYRSLATGPIPNDFFAHPSAVAILYSLLNPFFEELIVRAYLMTEVIDLTGSSTLAVALSVAVQFSYHLYYGWAGAISLSFLFLVFALYYVRTRSALPVIIAHGFFDLYALVRLW